MDYRRLGASGLMVPALSFGAGTFGGQGRCSAPGATATPRPPAASSTSAWRPASPCSTRADVYSDGACRGGSRRRPSRAAATRSSSPPRRPSASATGPNDVGSSRSHLISAVEDALSRLGTDYIDLFQLHAFDAGRRSRKCCRTLDDLVRAGKLRYVGCLQLLRLAADEVARRSPTGTARRAMSPIRSTTRWSAATTNGS